MSNTYTGKFTDFDSRLNDIARELSLHGLGIFHPHSHDESNQLSPLLDDVVSLENKLKVSFVKRSEIPGNAIPVGWRWNGNSLVACSYCCGDSGDGDGNGDTCRI